MLTELEIINEGLAAAGFARVGSLDSKHPAFRRAKNSFDIINTGIQARGWWFNRYVRTLTPDAEGKIVLPQHALVVDTEGSKYIERGRYLIDGSTGSFNIGQNVCARIIEKLPVDVIPAPAQLFVAASVKFSFYADESGNEPKLSLYAQLAAQAENKLRVEHLKHENVNYFDGLSGSAVRYPHAHSSRGHHPLGRFFK